ALELVEGLALGAEDIGGEGGHFPGLGMLVGVARMQGQDSAGWRCDRSRVGDQGQAGPEGGEQESHANQRRRRPMIRRQSLPLMEETKAPTEARSRPSSSSRRW